MSESDYLWTGTVGTKDCSNQKKIKFPVLMDYMQEAAWHNAARLGFSTLDLMKNNITWVMNRMRVNVHELPLHNVQMQIETWPAAMDKYYTKRDFRVKEGGRAVIEASSNWLVMDLRSRRLISIPDYIKNAGFVVDRGNLPTIEGKVVFDENKSDRSVDIQVSWFDLDINDHVNNTKIYQWILEGLGVDYLHQHEIKYIDILFKHEIKKGDTLKSFCYFEPDHGKWKHALINTENQKLHALAETIFEKSA